MKALMKGNAAAYFAKRQKPKEDIEEIMNQLEDGWIAKTVGIGEHQIKNEYAHFFELIHKIKLPKGYKRYLNTDKTKVIYANQNQNIETHIHPNIDNFKVAFYEIIKNDKAVYTSQTKTKRLLPFVQDKLMKQCIGLASKRRDAEKNNLQKDQNGKVVISKLARLKPEVKNLISSRSYMLKTLVQKIYTKKQLWGKGKRANVYAQIIAQHNRQKPGYDADEDYVVTEVSLELSQRIFTESKNFYYRQFGTLNYIPEELMKTKAFIKGTPDSVFRSLQILNIDKEEIELYWLARLMESLPLPQNWSRKLGDNFDQFSYEPEKLVFDLHPSYIYILENMNRFKVAFASMQPVQQSYYTTMRQMIFYDFFERPYYVDWFSYMSWVDQGKITRKKAQKISNQLQNNDWMALESIINSKMENRELPILHNLMHYWRTLNYQQQPYLPAISPFGQIIWSNRLNQRAIDFCPHSQKLKDALEVCVQKLPEINVQEDLKEYYLDAQDLKVIEHNTLYNILPEQRQNFLHHYLINDPKPLSQPYEHPQKYETKFFYDEIFISQFDLLSQVPPDYDDNNEIIVPLWLQKCRAKNRENRLLAILSNYSDKFNEIKKFVAKQAIKQADIHEPDRKEELYRMLQEEVTTIKQLKKFIKYTNDIDARQQRKRLAMLGMQKQEEQDLLGSSLSQIDVDQFVEESQEEGSQQNDWGSEQIEEPEIDDSSQQTPELEQKQEIEQNKQEQQVKPPQQYNGIIYQTNSQLEKIDEKDIDGLLLKLKKQKILKHKFSQKRIKDQVNYIQLHNPELTKDIKKNLLVSQLHSYHTPYKVSPSKANLRINHHNQTKEFYTRHGAPDITQQFSAFYSEADDYKEFNQEMHEFIENQKKNRPKIPTLSSESESIQSEEKKPAVDDTRETIQLQPIMRIKPDIKQDKFLMHISNFQSIQQYNQAFAISPTKKLSLNKYNTPSKTTDFNPEMGITQRLPAFDRNNQQLLLKTKLKLSKNIGEQSTTINQSKYRSNKLDKMSSMDSKLGLHKSQSLVHMNDRNSFENISMFGLNNNSSYKRVCLSNTAAGLLLKQPITRKGDLVRLQAQKDLIRKGRGLQTNLSKNY